MTTLRRNRKRLNPSSAPAIYDMLGLSPIQRQWIRPRGTGDKSDRAGRWYAGCNALAAWYARKAVEYGRPTWDILGDFQIGGHRDHLLMVAPVLGLRLEYVRGFDAGWDAAPKAGDWSGADLDPLYLFGHADGWESWVACSRRAGTENFEATPLTTVAIG